MAILLTNTRQIVTALNSTIWNAQTQATLAYRYRYENTGGLTSTILNNAFFVSRGLGSVYCGTLVGTAPGTLKLTFKAQVGINFVIHPGIAYAFMLTFDHGVVKLWVNGLLVSTVTTATTTTQSGTWGLAIGAKPFGTPWVATIDDLWSANGYVGTSDDAIALRDRTIVTLGQGVATWVGHWPLSGTTGATVQVGDAGLLNTAGDSTLPFSVITGTGSAVYADPLAFVPSALAAPYVATSGKSIGFAFKATSDGSAVMPTQATFAPTIAVNGVDHGPLINPWFTGYHPNPLYSTPAGLTILPTDVVTLSAPTGWANTAIGIAAPMDGQPVANLVGRSSFGIDQMRKTLKPGWNNAHLGSQFGGVYSVPKNWRFRCDSFGDPPSVTYDAVGRPIAATATTISSYFYTLGTQTAVDQTISFPTGLWAVGWDDLNPSSPTTLGLLTYSDKILSVTERLDLANPGTLVGGIRVGIVRVFQVTQIATTPQDGGFNAVASLRLQIGNTSETFRFANDVVYGPGDFASTPGVPTVLDRTDPYAISDVYLDRLRNGAGSLRWVDSLFGYAGISQESEPEQVFRMSDYIWGIWHGKTPEDVKDVYWTLARPWNQATSPYFYTTLFGSPYNVTLAAPIADATTTTVTITPDPANPVIIGLRLVAGSELMRVLGVSGATVTVERGSCSTTAAAHPAGTIQVQNRWAASGVTAGYYHELVCATPHGINTGQALRCYGDWPSMTYADGLVNIPETTFSPPLMVTGPNTAVQAIGGTPAGVTTLASTYTFDSTVRVGATWPDSPAIPVEFASRVTGHFSGCNFHVNVPHAASDSLVDQVAIWVRDNYPAGRTVYVEYSNEPWNFRFNNYNMLNFLSKWLYPSTHYGWEFYVARAAQVWQRFRDRFGDRQGEIVGLFNNNKFDAAGVAARLEFLKTIGSTTPVDVAIAVYTGFDTGAVSQVAFWQRDDEQAIDVYCHDLRTNTNGYTAILAAMNGVIAAHNAMYGEKVALYGYEGGVGCAAPVLSTSLSGAVNASTASVPVASSSGLSVVGTPLVCEGEWMTIAAPPTGNVLAVTRGQFGTTAATHASGKAIKTAFLERSHDMIYNPNWHFAEHELFAMCQLAGFAQVNQYALSMGAADLNSYFGAYHVQTQMPGYGDGRDGKADNRLVLCCPGKPNSKAATDAQDMVTVSVRGQAFINWMRMTALPRRFRNVFQIFRGWR